MNIGLANIQVGEIRSEVNKLFENTSPYRYQWLKTGKNIIMLRRILSKTRVDLKITT